MSDARIRVVNLVFSWPDGTPVLDGLSFALGAVRTGLVAPNGAGKSSLLKLLAGELSPLSGQVAIDGVVGYLPQNLPLDGEATVAEVLGIATRLQALEAIADGQVDSAHFDAVDGDWHLIRRPTRISR